MGRPSCSPTSCPWPTSGSAFRSVLRFEACLPFFGAPIFWLTPLESTSESLLAKTDALVTQSKRALSPHHVHAGPKKPFNEVEQALP